MKKLIVAFLILFFVLFFYERYQKQSPPVAESPQPAVASPTPDGQPVVTPAPVVSHLAPNGTFYVLEKISINTDDGVIGVSPGTKVTLVEDKGDIKIVSNGQDKFQVTAAQITNDLDLMDRILHPYAQAQPGAAVPTSMAAPPVASALPVASGPSQDQINHQNDVNNQVAALNQQKTDLTSQMATIQAAIDRQEEIDRLHPNTVIGRADVPALKQQKAQLQKQVKQIDVQIGQLGGQ